MAPDERQECRRELGLREGRPVISFIGRLTRDKGLQTLSRVVVEVPQRIGEVQFLIVGTPEAHTSEERALVERILRSKSVTWYRHIDAMERVYGASDLLILPTLREGLSTVLVEAGMSGVVAVAMDVTGTRDVLEDGRTGILVPGQNDELFVEAVASLLLDAPRRKAMAIAARASTTARFSRPDVWARWHEFYDSIRP